MSCCSDGGRVFQAAGAANKETALVKFESHPWLLVAGTAGGPKPSSPRELTDADGVTMFAR